MNIFFWVLVGIFIPQIVVILDYILKSMYIGYWDNFYQNRLMSFVENLGTNKTTIRRRTIDGFYIIKTFSIFSDKPYEFICDGKGNITVYDEKFRRFKPILGEALFALNSIKISDDQKSEYVSLLNSYDDDGDFVPINNMSPIIGPLKLAPKCDIKKMDLDSFSVQNNDVITIYLDDKSIRILAIKTFNKRKRESEPDLYKLINFTEYIAESVKRKIKTEDQMNKLITELIYSRVYGHYWKSQ